MRWGYSHSSCWLTTRLERVCKGSLEVWDGACRNKRANCICCVAPLLLDVTISLADKGSPATVGDIRSRMSPHASGSKRCGLLSDLRVARHATNRQQRYEINVLPSLRAALQYRNKVLFFARNLSPQAPGLSDKLVVLHDRVGQPKVKNLMEAHGKANSRTS